MRTDRTGTPQRFPSRLRDRTPLLVGVVVIPLAASCTFAMLPQMQRAGELNPSPQRHYAEWRAASAERERRPDCRVTVEGRNHWGQDDVDPQDSPIKRVTAWLEPERKAPVEQERIVSPPPPRPPRATALSAPPTAGRAPPSIC